MKASTQIHDQQAVVKRAVSRPFFAKSGEEVSLRREAVPPLPSRLKMAVNQRGGAFEQEADMTPYKRGQAPRDNHHVVEKKPGGPDAFENLWPLNESTNHSSESTVRSEIACIKAERGLTRLAGKWLYFSGAYERSSVLEPYNFSL